MKKSEREVLSELYVALSSIPFPAFGTQSSTVLGLSQFTAETRIVLPAVRNVLLALREESYDGELKEVREILRDAVTKASERR